MDNHNSLLSLSAHGVLIRSVDGRAWLLNWSEVGAALGGYPNDRTVVHASVDGGWSVHVGLRSITFAPGELETELFGLGKCVAFLNDDGAVIKMRSYESDHEEDILHESADDATYGNELCSITAKRIFNCKEAGLSIKRLIPRILEWSKVSITDR